MNKYCPQLLLIIGKPGKKFIGELEIYYLLKTFKAFHF